MFFSTMLRDHIVDRATIIVPSSTANVGLGYDVWCLGLAQPELRVTCTRAQTGVELEPVRSAARPPEGRALGHAGLIALKTFMKDFAIPDGVRLLYEDDGYPVGGLGRSGAEAVGAVMAAAILFEKRLLRDEVIVAAAKAEPGEHMDNVAGSANGRFNVIVTAPATGTRSADVYDVPEDLGIAIGYSLQEKLGGTTAMREVLEQPLPTAEFVIQTGLLSAATAALVTGNTGRFLDLVWGDGFHEPRRADAGGYGAFTAADLAAFKRRLFADFHVALNISGAGPNIQLLYDKKELRDGIGDSVSGAVAAWFQDRGIAMSVRDTEIAGAGAYDYAQREYGY